MDLTDEIFEPGSESHPGSIKLETRTRIWIRNEQFDEMHPEQLDHHDRQMKKFFDGIFLRSLTATYNCHGMVFATRRTAIVEPGDVEMILFEDGYEKLNDPNSAERGDVIAYRLTEDAPISHTGVVINYGLDRETLDKSFLILSKWGQNGEYIHNEKVVPPTFGDFREFYSERKIQG